MGTEREEKINGDESYETILNCFFFAGRDRNDDAKVDMMMMAMGLLSMTTLFFFISMVGTTGAVYCPFGARWQPESRVAFKTRRTGGSSQYLYR